MEQQNSTIHWENQFCSSKKLNHPDFTQSEWYDIPDDPLITFYININRPSLIRYVDATQANKLQKQRSTTGLVYTFCCGAIVYKSKMQSLTAGSSTEAEFIAAHTAAKIE